MGFPQAPAFTSLRLVNEHVPFPLVTDITPSVVHFSGWAITVRGSFFQRNSTVFFGTFPVSNLTADAASNPYTWVWSNLTQTAYPVHKTGDAPSNANGALNTVCKVLDYCHYIDAGVI